jgi:hypothetical protein
MDDGLTRFLAKLARSVGRLDFWNLLNELSPQELRAQQALMAVEPWGDDRADLRAAVHTVTSHKFQQPDDALDALTRYLKVQQHEEEIHPDVAAKLFGAK